MPVMIRKEAILSLPAHLLAEEENRVEAAQGTNANLDVLVGGKPSAMKVHKRVLPPPNALRNIAAKQSGEVSTKHKK